MRVQQPAQRPAPALPVIDVRAVRIARLVGEGVVLAMVGDPADDRPLDRGRAEDREGRAQRTGRREAAVREQAMEADGDAERGERVEDREDDRSLQKKTLCQASQAPMISDANGTTVIVPVMMRSRVSLATGWTSSGPAPEGLSSWRSTWR